MSRRKKKGMPTGILIALVVIAAVLCLVLVTVMYMDNHGQLGNSENENLPADVTDTNENTDADTGTDEKKEADAEEAETEVVSAMDTEELAFPDFDNGLYLDDVKFKAIAPGHDDVNIEKLQDEENPEIYAWLYAPHTGIDYPVLQHEDHDDYAFYSSHNEKGEPDEKGALNTEYFNLKEFKDYLTVIYGRNIGDGTMFSNLELYRDPAFFKDNPYIYVYTKDELLVYKTFAAYEFDDVHLILFYVTSVDFMYEEYIKALEDIPGIDANVDKTAWPGKDDRILTLSTYLRNDPNGRRYLVQARLVGVRKLSEQE